jgi:starch-binding outer membrane protein, SusD/RagB family
MRLLFFTGMILFGMLIASCKKEWLEKKSDQSLLIPSTLEDCQLLINNSDKLNLREPALDEIGTDIYYTPYESWIYLSENDRNAYVWAPRIYSGYDDATWQYEYEKIFFSNAVLNTLDKIGRNDANSSRWDILRGAALFFRASGHYNLVSLFAKPYDPATSQTDAGVPLRTSPDVNEKVSRGNVKQVYQQIIADLKEAVELLPAAVEYLTRPSKAACYGLLADISLNMGQFADSRTYAGAALNIYSTLLDFNNFDAASNVPFTRFNQEVIFHSNELSYGIISSGTTYIDTLLYASYDNNDLRKVLYFRDRVTGYTFKGSYNQGSYAFFSGIATDELYLVRAEAAARLNDVGPAMTDLNTLLVKRWKAGTYTDLTANSPAEALTIILTERKKELIFRGRRWNDLRRLNKEPAFAITLQRKLNGQAYILPPGDPRYVLPIPDKEIRLSGLEQNKRD